MIRIKGGNFGKNILTKRVDMAVRDNDNGMCVYKKPGEDGERLIKRFKKKISKCGIISELKNKRYYVKPSERKKRKRMEAIKNQEELNNEI